MNHFNYHQWQKNFLHFFEIFGIYHILLLYFIIILLFILINQKYSADELDDLTKNTFLSYFLWFGAHKAIQSGFWDISYGMLR